MPLPSWPPCVRRLDSRHKPITTYQIADLFAGEGGAEYFGKLSEASVYTLSVQGGPMSAEEVTAFETGPHAADAVRLRRWDEAAKEPDAGDPGFEHYRDLLLKLVTSGS